MEGTSIAECNKRQEALKNHDPLHSERTSHIEKENLLDKFQQMD